MQRGRRTSKKLCAIELFLNTITVSDNFFPIRFIYFIFISNFDFSFIYFKFYSIFPSLSSDVREQFINFGSKKSMVI